ncbi:MAG: cupin domain-containing protein [Pseudomonadota bacterium]
MTELKRNFADLFSRFDDHWSPKVAGVLDQHLVKVVKIAGAFDWHSHANEDELFIVMKGVLRMEFRDHVERISAGEFIIVPKGVEHRPCAETPEVEMVLIERDTVVNTGDGPDTQRTVRDLERLT